MSQGPPHSADPSRSHKWVLLISSILALVGLVAAAVRENVLAPWRRYQTEYARILRAKASDDLSRRAARRFRVEMRQVVLTALGTVDRCVSCHTGAEDPRMGDQPQPFRTHPGDHLKHHPVSQFGCTSCHRGQGAAITFLEAKAQTVAWHSPMLPIPLTEASCGSCHDPDALAGRGAGWLALGAKLFRERGCRSCHALDGQGGPRGPALDRVGLKAAHELPLARLRGEHSAWNWHHEHLRDPGAIVHNSKMPTPQLTAKERRAVVTYLLSLVARDNTRRYTPGDRVLQMARRIQPPPPDGGQIYREFCRSCHGDGTYTRWDGKMRRFVPAIRGRGLLETADDDLLLQSIRRGRAGTDMPAWHERAGGLARPEQEALVRYLRAAVPGRSAAGRWSAPTGGNAAAGRALFARQCAGCHGEGGRGGIAPSLANPDFLELAPDSFIAATIERGRVDTPMPAFRDATNPILNRTEVAGLVAYLRSLAPSPRTQRGRASR